MNAISKRRGYFILMTFFALPVQATSSNDVYLEDAAIRNQSTTPVIRADNPNYEDLFWFNGIGHFDKG